MPELESEFPSSNELAEYFSEHWLESGKPLEDFFLDAGVNGSKLVKKVYDSIWSSLNRLNDFPRENHFWNNTNKKPTIYKLQEFCKLQLENNGKDDLAQWTLFSMAVFFGSNIFEKEEWKSFWKKRDSDIEILVLAEFFMDLTAGGDGEVLADLLIDLNLVEEAVPKIKEIKFSKFSYASEWAERVLNFVGVK